MSERKLNAKRDGQDGLDRQDGLDGRKEKFTPRPWRAVDVGYGFRIEPDVCWIGENSNVTKEQRIANKNLIENAPNMYAALKEIASMQPGESYDDECDIYEDCGHCWDMIAIAKDALKKARGEE